jgi:hypothetical protein
LYAIFWVAICSKVNARTRELDGMRASAAPPRNRHVSGKSGNLSEAAGMMHYSVYVIGADGRISRRIDLHCPTDDDAKQRAQLIACQHQTVELWQEARMIAEFTRPR